MIIFDPVKHVYSNSLTGAVYTSVTRVIEKFKTPFEKEKMARLKAAQRGVPYDIILQEWEEIAQKAKEYGTKMHSVVEEFCKTGIIHEEHKDFIEKFQQFGDFSVASGTLVETRVHNHEFQVAGTADIIKPDGGYFDVFDLKTNKEFRFQSKYQKFLLSPVDHLTECEYSTYSLQLSIYALLYHLMTGRIPRRLTVLYYDKVTTTFTAYPVAYLKHDALNILKHL